MKASVELNSKGDINVSNENVLILFIHYKIDYLYLLKNVTIGLFINESLQALNSKQRKK